MTQPNGRMSAEREQRYRQYVSDDALTMVNKSLLAHVLRELDAVRQERDELSKVVKAFNQSIITLTAERDAARKAAGDAVILAERDPDDYGARYAYDRALEWVAGMIESGYRPGDIADAHALVMTIRAGKKHPEITDPITYRETWDEAVEMDRRHTPAPNA